MSDTLTPAEQATVDIARARWRAELLDYDAALYEQIGKPDIADSKRAGAALHRTCADVTERYEQALAAHGSKHPDTVAAALELRETRRVWRDVYLSFGGTTASVLDNFTEPSARELLEGAN
jgi:hypothetical protein